MRAGRNYAVMNFRRLTADEAVAARAGVGLEAVAFDMTKQYALSDAFNFDSTQEHSKRHAAPFGFTGA